MKFIVFIFLIAQAFGQDRQRLWDQARSLAMPQIDSTHSDNSVYRSRQITALFNDDDFFFYDDNGMLTAFSFDLDTRTSTEIELQFNFVDRARELIYISLFSNSNQTGTVSRDHRDYEIFVFPRILIPSVWTSENERSYIVTLPTNETITITKNSNTIINGPFSTTRLYTGAGLSITLSGLGRSPREDRGGNAEIRYQGQSCGVSKSVLFHQNADMLRPKFVRDGDVYNIVERECGWNLESLRRWSQEGQSL